MELPLESQKKRDRMLADNPANRRALKEMTLELWDTFSPQKKTDYRKLARKYPEQRLLNHIEPDILEKEIKIKQEKEEKDSIKSTHLQTMNKTESKKSEDDESIIIQPRVGTNRRKPPLPDLQDLKEGASSSDVMSFLNNLPAIFERGLASIEESSKKNLPEIMAPINNEMKVISQAIVQQQKEWYEDRKKLQQLILQEREKSHLEIKELREESIKREDRFNSELKKSHNELEKLREDLVERDDKYHEEIRKSRNELKEFREETSKREGKFHEETKKLKLSVMECEDKIDELRKSNYSQKEIIDHQKDVKIPELQNQITEMRASMTELQKKVKDLQKSSSVSEKRLKFVEDSIKKTIEKSRSLDFSDSD